MAHLDILLYPHPVLRENCQEVEEVNDDIRELLDNMAETMYAAHGVGLAAPQIGVAKRIIVIDVEAKGEQLIELINPKIVEFRGKKIKQEEGCLSFPGHYGGVTRPEEVTVEALNRDGETFTVEGSELLSVALQHEIDHLNGVLFIDHLSRLKRGLIERKMLKTVKGQTHPVRQVKK
ncbi:MAG TPA: peptide deformylase [Myxococcales bacterium]|mgnify:CR=1 FL=1|nr:peptide deformylase [Deltaproteobacteria bacterium]MBU54446.1 peptide deformylase [Deltaproteobacteria bacterium]HAA56621.1 peptide deformylase [Myxococcales bacterium]|tara:strand:+ start:7603 stop:8133 length:531 start_codon:yes stop_codon:yes gene_type:complete